jgi:hypothetical protein
MAITLGSLKTRILRQADMENTLFVSDTELGDLINDELAGLYDILITRYEDQGIRIPAPDIQVRVGIEKYPLPRDFYKLRAIYEHRGGKRYRLLPFEFTELANSESPRTDATLEIFYVPQYEPIADDETLLQWFDHFILPFGWERYIIGGAAAALLIKEESDPSGALMLKQETLNRIMEASVERDTSEPCQIRNTMYQPSRGSELRYSMMGKWLFIRRFVSNRALSILKGL